MAQAVIPLLILSLAATVATTVVTAIGQKKQAKAQQEIAETQARNEERAAGDRADQLRRRRARLLASQRAAFAGRGLKLSGSPLEVLAETNEIVQLDIDRVIRAGSERAGLLRQRGAAAVQSARFQQLGTILGGVGQAASIGAGIGQLPRFGGTGSLSATTLQQ